MHPNCRCHIVWMEAKRSGTATRNGVYGADWWLKYHGTLPPYYVKYKAAIKFGWIPALGNLSNILHGKMITRGVFRNNKEKLPIEPGRIWYEADINYSGGRRGTDRVLFSNDGLIFVSYDHYTTFCEIV